MIQLFLEEYNLNNFVLDFFLKFISTTYREMIKGIIAFTFIRAKCENVLIVA